jgi:hypothetical protein
MDEAVISVVEKCVAKDLSPIFRQTFFVRQINHAYDRDAFFGRSAAAEVMQSRNDLPCRVSC